jgi:tetratricopeptide (TPR) repeat protein
LALLAFTLGASGQDHIRYREDWKNPALSKAKRFSALQDLCWYWRERDGDSAKAWSRVFLTAALDSGSNMARADAWNTVANLHLDEGTNVEAMKALAKGRELIDDSDLQRLATYHNNLSLAYQQLGDHATAIAELLRSKSIAEAARDTIGIVNAMGNLGVTYALRKDYARSAQSFEAVIAIARAKRDTAMLLNTLGNLGAVYSEMGQLAKARVPLEESLSYFEANPAKIDGSYATASINLGIVEQRLGNLDRSDALLLQGMRAHAQAGSRNDVANAQVNLGGNALLRKRFREAQALCSRALATVDSLGTLVEMQGACQCLVEANEGLGKFEAALHYHKRMVAAKDSLVNAGNIEQIARMEAQFEFHKQQLADSLSHAAALAQLEDERTIEQLRADQNRNRALATGGAAILLLLGGGAWFYTDRKRRRERFEKEAATLETQALRSQMNPHFIFNALNSINAFVQQNDQDSASSYLTKFARVMRSVLENSRHSEVPLQDDLDTLRGYLELERKRSQEKFEFSITVDPAIDPETVLVPPLVVQPFVENAIWHGMAGKQGKGHIVLHVSQRGKQLVWSIEDDGAGRHAPKAELPEGATAKKTSLGTAITRSRLDLVQKQHGGTAGFTYIDLPQGTRVEVEMPLLSAN